MDDNNNVTLEGILTPSHTETRTTDIINNQPNSKESLETIDNLSGISCHTSLESVYNRLPDEMSGLNNTAQEILNKTNEVLQNNKMIKQSEAMFNTILIKLHKRSENCEDSFNIIESNNRNFNKRIENSELILNSLNEEVEKYKKSFV